MRVNVRISSLWGEAGRQGEAAGNGPKTCERETGEQGIQDAGSTPGNRRLVRLGGNARSHTEIPG